MKIYLDNNLGVTNVEQEELTQDTIGYNILKVYIPNAVLTPYDTFTCYYGALLQNGRKVGWFAMEARTSTDADYEANYTLYKATLEQCVVSVEGKVYIGCQVLLGNSGNATLIKKNTAVVQFNVRKSVAINNDILVLDPDQTNTDVLESYKNLLENALLTYATKAEVYTKTQADALLANKADKSDTYTKAQVDNRLSLKADKSDTYTKTEVDGKLALKADKTTTYTKTEVDGKLDLKADKSKVNEIARSLTRDIGEVRAVTVALGNETQVLISDVDTLQDDVADLKSVQNVVEVVATYSALQSYDTSKLDVNDKVQVIADETHDGASTIYNWNGSAWQYVGAFGGNSYTKAETYNKTQIDSALSDKADKSNVYTRAVIDSMILTLATEKADKSTTYTKTEIDGKLEEIGPMFEIVEKELEKKSKVVANPTLSGNEETLDGLEVDGTKYKVGGGSAIVTLDDIVDSQGNKRFIEGNGTPATITGVTFTYNKWSLSGTHLMVVVAGSIDNGTTIPQFTHFGDFDLPDFIFNKIQTVWGSNIETKSIQAFNFDWSSQTIGTYLTKTTRLSILTNGAFTATKDRNFRIQFDVLIDQD